MKDFDPARGEARPTDAPALLSDLLGGVTRLAQNEIALAKAEIGQKISRAGAGIAMMVVAALVALSGLHVLAAAAVTALIAAGLSAPVAALVVALVALGLAAILFFAGKARLDPRALVPERALRNVRADVRTVKENTHA